MAQVNKSKEKIPMPELDATIRSRTFDEVTLGYSEAAAVQEALRCIHCPKAPCVTGCPVGVPISDFVREVGEGNFARAYALVKNTNTLPAICGRVCPQETQCEGVCTRGNNGEPVGIGRLERFVADWAFAHPEEAAVALAEVRSGAVCAAVPSEDTAPVLEETKRAANDSAHPEETESASGAVCGFPACATGFNLTGKRVAVVGSGPASLTCAGELAKCGAEVTIFEALHEVGGVLTYGIPEFRLPKALVKKEVAAIEDLGVIIEKNALIGALYDIEELTGEMGFDAVFVGTGAGLPSYLGIEGEGLNGAMVASELLTRVNLMKAYKFPEYATPIYAGKHCVVVGGGNVAMDAARTARRLGAEVTVVYRRGKEEMPARDEEIHHAEQEGIKFQMLTNPERVLGTEDGWVGGLECVRMELGEADASGRRSPIEIADSTFVIDIDMLVIAIGSKTNPLIAKTTPGLTVTSRNLVVADEETCATSVPGVFAGGDTVIGAATVILAMGAGKRAAKGIAAYLSA